METAEPTTGPAMRAATADDVSFMVTQHHEHFPDNVFGRLGDGFLRRHYASFVDSPHAVALVVVSGAAPAGHLAGVTDVGRHRAWLKRHRLPSLGASVLTGLVRHPLLARSLLLSRWRRWRATRREDGAAPAGRAAGPARDVGPVAVLTHVALSASVQGHGQGQTLVDTFVESARTAGATRVAVATAEGNRRARALYERNGWVESARRVLFDGRTICVYDRSLTVPETRDAEHPMEESC